MPPGVGACISRWPWEQQGGILVGFLELGDGSHAVPELLQRRVDACRNIFGLLHDETVVDEADEFELVAVTVGSAAGFVQFVAMRLGAALQYVSLVAVLELLWLGGQPALLLPSPRVRPPKG